MRRLTLREYAVRSYEPVPADVAAALGATGIVKVGADLSGRTVLTAGSKVGVVRAGDVEVRVVPKMPVHRLLWLIGHARDQKGWRDDDVGLAPADDLVAGMAVSFVAATNRALAAGLLQGYRVTEEDLPVLRGRLREGDQLRRGGAALPLAVRYDDYSVDIPENQLLRAAALRLSRVPGIPPRTHGALHRLLLLLADVSPLVPGERLPTTREDRLARRYAPALRLARLVLAGRSVDQAAGSVTASGFVFDLTKVFEDWLTVALRASLAAYPGVMRTQLPGHLDIGRRLRIKPDFVWQVGGSPVAVADAKYKQLRLEELPHADVYQMLAYCTALDVPVGHLIYAQGTGTPTHHVVRNTEKTVVVWNVDLSAPATELLTSVGVISRAIAGGL